MGYPYPGINEAFAYSQIAATTTVKTGVGLLGGVFISAASATPTVTIYDNTAASGTKIVDTFTPVAATNYPFPAHFGTGLTIVISGTVSLTAFYV